MAQSNHVSLFGVAALRVGSTSVFGQARLVMVPPGENSASFRSAPTQCTVLLKSPTGRLYDEKVLNFPPPASAAQGLHQAKAGLPATAPNDTVDHQRRPAASAINSKNAEINPLRATAAARQGRIESVEQRVAQLEKLLTTTSNNKEQVTP